jgi:hypothetical protein
MWCNRPGTASLFDAPLAHEDHPQRALYGVLGMQEELHQYAERLTTSEEHSLNPLQLEARVGTQQRRSRDANGRNRRYASSTRRSATRQF